MYKCHLIKTMLICLYLFENMEIGKKGSLFFTCINISDFCFFKPLLSINIILQSNKMKDSMQNVESDCRVNCIYPCGF